MGEALAYDGSGDPQEAEARLRTLLSSFPNEAAYQLAEVYAVRGELDRGFEWLEIARTQKDAGLSAIIGDPPLKNLRTAFLKRCG